jgi:hypothetical protein
MTWDAGRHFGPNKANWKNLKQHRTFAEVAHIRPHATYHGAAGATAHPAAITAHPAAIDAQCAAHSARSLSPFGDSSRTLARCHIAGVGDTSKTRVRISHPLSFFVGAANRLINLRADFGRGGLRENQRTALARCIICYQAEQRHDDTRQKYGARFHDFSPSGLGRCGAIVIEQPASGARVTRKVIGSAVEMSKQSSFWRTGASLAAILLLAAPLLATDASAQFRGRGGGGIGGGGGGGGGWAGRGGAVMGGGGGSPGVRSLAAGRFGGSGIRSFGGQRFGGAGIRSFSGPRFGGVGARSLGAPRIGASNIGASNIGRRFTGRSLAPTIIRGASVGLRHNGGLAGRFTGNSPRTFTAAAALSRPGFARGHAAWRGRAITNAALRSSFVRAPRFHGRFHGSQWPCGAAAS